MNKHVMFVGVILQFNADVWMHSSGDWCTKRL